MPIDRYSRAHTLYRKGRLHEAETACRDILRHAPRDVAALSLLGYLQLSQGKPDEAILSFEEALRVNSQLPNLHRGLAIAMVQGDRLAEAIAHYDAALALRPQWPDLLFRRGNALQRLGRHAEALRSYDDAIALKSDYADAHGNRAAVLVRLGLHEEALASHDRALAIDAGDATTLYNRGNVLGRLNRHAEAVESYDRALVVRPDFVEALNNRGMALAHLWRFEEAVSNYSRALALTPTFVDAIFNRGNALRRLGMLVDARADYQKAYALRPEHPGVLGAMVRCELLLCDWDGVERHSAELHRRVSDGTARLAPFSWLSVFDDPAGHLACARTAVRVEADGAQAHNHCRSSARRDRLRIAYVSPNFREHNLPIQVAELFAIHDRTRFDILAISHGRDDGSAMRARLIGASDEFHDVAAQGDRAVAALMRERRIDIAVDLNGHLDMARWGIFARRPAPVQVNYLGYPGTSGADFIDYVIGDPTITPFAQQGCYSEKIVQLPDSYLVNDRRRRIAPYAPTREECGLPQSGFVFCSFNHLSKIRPPVFDVWMRLLASIEGSVLWLPRDSERVIANLRQEATRRGVDPTRLVFAERLERQEDHLARHCAADLFLDTLPFNAHTTACDALWAGLPILTCLGRGFAARVGASVLRAAGLPELVTRTLEEYEARARQIAADTALLGSLRQRLSMRNAMLPLFDTERFCRHIESAYLTMWETWESGQPPRSFRVEERS